MGSGDMKGAGIGRSEPEKDGITRGELLTGAAAARRSVFN